MFMKKKNFSSVFPLKNFDKTINKSASYKRSILFMNKYNCSILKIFLFLNSLIFENIYLFTKQYL